MTNNFRLSMNGLHTWAGLLPCWLLYFIFLTGTLGYFDTEIDQWMQPDIVNESEPVSMVHSIKLAQKHLQQQAPKAYTWYINPPADRNELYLWVAFNKLLNESGGEGEYLGVELNPLTGEAIEFRETGGGQTLYKMHYALHYIPDLAGTLLVGLCTIFMLLALMTGIVIHKKIFKEFFTFRPRKKVVSWMDAHNVFGVMSLPFYLMITYSGLVMFMFTYMPLIVAGAYSFESKGYQSFGDDYLGSNLIETKRSGTNADVIDLTLLYDQAEKILGRGQVRRLQVYQPGDTNAIAIFEALVNHPVNERVEVAFNAVTGKFIHSQKITDTPRLIYSTTTELHEGLFATNILRWLFFLSGILGAAMIATGSILWTVKRRKREYNEAKKPSKGFQLVEGLNIGTVAGLPIAIIIYFWANRLLPVNMEDRANWEVHCLFISWLVLLVHGIWRSMNNQGNKAWYEQLVITTLAFGLLPIVNIFTTDRGLWLSFINQDWIFLAVDFICFSIALICAATVWHLSKKMPVKIKEKQQNRQGLFSLIKSNKE